MKFLCTLTVGMAVTLSSFWAQPGLAQDETFDWKLNNNFALSDADPRSTFFAEYADDITKSTDGKLTVKAYHGGSLNLKDADVLRWLPKGVVEMAVIWPIFVGRDAPALQSSFMSGIVTDDQQYGKAEPVLEEITEEALKEWEIESVAIMPSPVYQISVMCREEPVNSLESLREKKLRVFTADQIKIFTKLGVSAQIIPQNEVYSALQTGVVDCMLYAGQSLRTFGLEEVVSHAAYLFPLMSLPHVIGVSEDKWAELPDSTKEKVNQAGETLRQKFVDYSHEMLEREMNERKMLEETGKVTWAPDFSPEDQQAFREAAREVWVEATDKVGETAVAYRQRIEQVLDN
jgi:TRAP-type transport system periplasmic protein